MINTILSFGLSKTNYSLVNINNQYNFLIDVFELLYDERSKNKFIEKMKINIGHSFFNDFKAYCLGKLSVDHDLIKFLK